MNVIVLDESNPNSLRLYEAFDNMFYFLAEKLPKFFLDPVMLDGEVYHLPKYITKLHYDSIDADTQDLMTELNKQLNEKLLGQV